jgi:hypothetical protein
MEQTARSPVFITMSKTISASREESLPMLYPRWVTLGVASLAMFLAVWASDAAQQTQPPAKDAPQATPK